MNLVDWIFFNDGLNESDFLSLFTKNRKFWYFTHCCVYIDLKFSKPKKLSLTISEGKFQEKYGVSFLGFETVSKEINLLGQYETAGIWIVSRFDIFVFVWFS